MEIRFVFNGIRLSEGKYPSAEVSALFDLDDPQLAGLALPAIAISLPLNETHLAQTHHALAQAAVATAHQLVRADALAAWLQQLRQAPG